MTDKRLAELEDSERLTSPADRYSIYRKKKNNNSSNCCCCPPGLHSIESQFTTCHKLPQLNAANESLPAAMGSPISVEERSSKWPQTGSRSYLSNCCPQLQQICNSLRRLLQFLIYTLYIFTKLILSQLFDTLTITLKISATIGKTFSLRTTRKMMKMKTIAGVQEKQQRAAGSNFLGCSGNNCELH